MPKFLVDVRFCKRNGQPGRWSGTLTAANLGSALELGRRELHGRYREPTKVDIYAVAIDPPASPAVDSASS